MVNGVDINELWQKCLLKIKEKVGDGVFDLWFKPMKVLNIKEKTVTMEVPNRFFKDWIDDYYPNFIPEIIEGILGFGVNVKYKVAEKAEEDIRKMDMKLESRKNRLASRGIFLNPKYTFNSFVVGPSNQFAHAAALRVAENPGSAYNPLFIYGGVGLGKTHILNAIGNAFIDRRHSMIVCYVSSEQFTNEVITSLRHGKMAELKDKYRNVDALLMDDIQFISGKTTTQEEFFHTFNALYEKQKQIVVSSDRPPQDISDITDRLRSRFNMGLIADIQPPEIETKIAILYKKAEIERIHIPEDVAYFIASRVKSNIRDLEGCLIKLGAYSSLSGIPIEMEMAKMILKDFISDEEVPITAELVQKIVCEHLGIKVHEIKARKRTKELANARQIAMYLTKKHTSLSLSEIGRLFGGKDHATVLYACRQVEEKRQRDENFNRLIEGINRKILDRK